MSKIKIAHSADLQVKNNKYDLFNVTTSNLSDIHDTIRDEQVQIAVFTGDFFEFGNVDNINDSERKMIYMFISNLLQIETLQELIIIAGNHDLVLEKQQQENLKDNNPLDVFATVIQQLSDNSNKLKYFRKSGIYQSSVSNDIQYVVYSLEDKNYPIPNGPEYSGKLNIVLYHDMLFEYIQESKLPVPEHITNRLDHMDIFPKDSYILAGDIHEEFEFVSPENNAKFFYPGSPMQHTHNEGSSIKITIPKYSAKIRPEKNILIHEVDGLRLTTRKSPLKKHIEYTTITLDHTKPASIILDTFKQMITDNILDVCSENIIKIKTANTLLEIENDIRESLTGFYSKHQDIKFKISFDYSKFVAADVMVNSEVSSIISEKDEELIAKELIGNNTEVIITDKNIDDLLLNESQLERLFDICLKNLTEKIDEEFNITDKIKTLFTTELKQAFNASSERYKIQLLSVQTQSFMALGDNIVNLSIPGITRILGTNGLGKTTLYNMIRWIITGNIYEHMSVAQQVKNTLLCFNNKRGDIDFCDAQLTVNVNGVVYNIYRIANRIWKTGTTEEQKVSDNWQDLIVKVERKLTITGQDTAGQVTLNISDNEAEQWLKNVFGNIINTIVLLDEFKIEKMLRQSSKDLNEMILNLIGIDYLNILEDRLDTVKDQLNLPKPKRKKEEIIGDIDAYEGLKKGILKDIVLSEENQKLLEADIKKLSETKESTNNAIINNGGNIENQKQELSTTITEQQTAVDTFVLKTLLPLETTDAIQPVLDEAKISELNNSKTLLVEKKDLIVAEKLENLEQTNKVCESIVEYQKVTKEKIDENIANIEQSISDEQANLLLIRNNVTEAIDAQKPIVAQRLSHSQKTYQETLVSINQLTNNITSKKNEITNGICSSCNKPIMDDPKEWESHKLKLQEDINQFEIDLKKLNEDLNTINQDSVVIKNHSNFINIHLPQNLDTIDNFEQDLPNYELLTEYSDIEKALVTYIENRRQVKTNKTEYEKKIGQFKMLENMINEMSLIQYANYSVEGKSPKIDEFVNSFKTLKTKESELDINIGNINTEITGIDNSILSIKNQYTLDLQAYQSILDNLKTKNDAITESNKTVTEHNDKLKPLQFALETSKQQMEVLEQKLPIYLANKELLETTTESLDAKTTELTDINEDIFRNKNQIESYNHRIEKLVEERTAFDDYFIAQTIWKIYSKIIKTSFRNIVFEYYRNYLNNTLNELLSDVNFKLFWDKSSELKMTSIKQGLQVTQSVQQGSGMETTFMGLSLIYTAHMLNVKNSISHLFIDEISGTLNTSKELSYEASNYQELFVSMISKFSSKSLFIIDHNIQNMYETMCYEVQPNNENQAIYVTK